MINRAVLASVLALVALMAGVSLSSAQQGDAAAAPPFVLSMEDLQFRIADATFVSEYQGANGSSFKETQMDQYRGLVLTVEVRKPAGKELTLVAQDISLHYNYGTSSDVAGCFGLSAYSAEKDADRAMSLYPGGYGRSATGLSTTKASVVYVDMFFQNMEPSTSQLHLFIAQPVGASFETTGWE